MAERENKMAATGHLLQKKLDSLEKAMQERAKKEPDTPTPPAEIIQLPLWSEPVRGTPNPVLRGALFAAIQGKQAKYLDRLVLASQKGLEIRFTGKQLSQSDMDVWEQALHIARGQPLGSYIEFSAHAFLKALGRSTGSPMHEWLKGVFARLTACCVEITVDEKLTYGGNLLEFFREEETKRYKIQLNPKLLGLFDTGWTEVDFKQRRLLKRKPLAQWLHGFLATHKEPYAMKIETYRDSCGSYNRSLKGFKDHLKVALNELVKIHYIRSYEIKGGLVHITRSANDVQKIHGPRRRPLSR